MVFINYACLILCVYLIFKIIEKIIMLVEYFRYKHKEVRDE